MAEAQISDALRAWLTTGRHEVNGWEPEPPLDEMRCHPDLVERLTQISRPIRGVKRAWVDGCPVVHHTSGAPIACASGTGWLVVRSGRPAGALTPTWHVTALGDAWVDLDPWAADVTFAQTIEMLRAHVRAAFDRAGSGPGQ
jgi:hypothetical protein